MKKIRMPLRMGASLIWHCTWQELSGCSAEAERRGREAEGDNSPMEGLEPVRLTRSRRAGTAEKITRSTGRCRTENASFASYMGRIGTAAAKTPGANSFTVSWLFFDDRNGDDILQAQGMEQSRSDLDPLSSPF